MSLFRQIWLTILGSMLLVMSAALLISMLNAKHCLEEQLSFKNHDTANTLALSLSQGTQGTDALVKTAQVLFETGHFALVRVTAPDNRVLGEWVAEYQGEGASEAPAWFVRLLAITPEPGQAQVTQGWNQIGRITVYSHSHFAYTPLWEMARNMALVIVLGGLLAGALTHIALKRLLRPMQTVVGQARALSEHRFITIPLPAVPELHQLAQAMNEMVERLRTKIEGSASQCEALRLQANYDKLTSLPNRAFFMAQLDQRLEGEEASGGGLALVRLDRLQELNHQLGFDASDRLLMQIGEALADVAASHSGALAGRLSGADFALLLPSSSDMHAMLETMAERMAHVADAFIASYPEQGPCCHCGITPFAPGEDAAAVLSRADAALASAEGSGTTCRRAFIDRPEDDPLPRSASAWSDAFDAALMEAPLLSLTFTPLHNAVGALFDSECSLRMRLDADGPWLPEGVFLPVAERMGLIDRFDLALVERALAELRNNPGDAGLWLTLSPRSLARQGFIASLQDLLAAAPAEARRLWLALPESGAVNRVYALRELIHSVRPLGCRVGLEHYGHQHNSLGRIYDLGLDFIRIDAALVRLIDANKGNHAYLTALAGIAHTLGMHIYAEGVETATELATLQALGFDGYTGAAVQSV